MADRFWVGGTDSWNGTAGSKWSTTSGGAGGSAEPTAADDVKLDGNSGTGTTTIATIDAECRSFITTGYTGTFTINRSLSIGDGTVGNFTLGSGMTFNGQSFRVISFKSTVGTNNVTTNGIAIPCQVNFDGIGGTWQLQDAITVNGDVNSISVTNGTLNTNGVTVTALNFVVPGGTLTLGASSISLTTTSTVWNVATGATLNSNTSTINITDTSATAKTIILGGKTYNNMSITSGGTGVVTFSGATANTFNTLTLAGPKSVRFVAGQTQTFTSFVADGTAGNLVTIDSSLAGTAATYSDAAGTNALTYCSLQDFAATGGATWTAASSTNVSGNSGITFLVVGGGSTTTSTAMLVGVG